MYVRRRGNIVRGHAARACDACDLRALAPRNVIRKLGRQQGNVQRVLKQIGEDLRALGAASKARAMQARARGIG